MPPAQGFRAARASDAVIVDPRVAALILATLLSLAIAGELLWMPVQVSDSLDEILDAQTSPSIAASFVGGTQITAFLRPLRIAQTKALYDLAQGRHYWLVYRGFHALLVIAAVFLFVRALRIHTTIDAGAAAFAIVVLIGLHSFRGLVQEAFPINHFLEIVVCCLLTLNLARSRGGLWADVLAALVFVAAVLTLESGLVVWVVAAAAWLVGWRGVSLRGIAVMSVLLAGYFYVRFFHLPADLPTIAARSSGYLFAILDPPELQKLFRDQTLWFAAYNVVTSIASVLFSEPRAGVFVVTRAWMNDALLPREVIPVVTSLLTTGLISWVAVHRARHGGTWDDTSRLLVLFAVVLVANALFSYAYTKDEIISIAGVFYAIAAFAAMRTLLDRVSHMRPAAAVVIGLLAVTLTVGWTVRAAGLHYKLRAQAFRQQNDWAGLPYTVEWKGRWTEDMAAREIVLRLHADAVGMKVPNTRVGLPRWVDSLWED